MLTQRIVKVKIEEDRRYADEREAQPLKMAGRRSVHGRRGCTVALLSLLMHIDAPNKYGILTSDRKPQTQLNCDISFAYIYGHEGGHLMAWR